MGLNRLLKFSEKLAPVNAQKLFEKNSHIFEVPPLALEKFTEYQLDVRTVFG